MWMYSPCCSQPISNTYFPFPNGCKNKSNVKLEGLLLFDHVIKPMIFKSMNEISDPEFFLLVPKNLYYYTFTYNNI